MSVDKSIAELWVTGLLEVLKTVLWAVSVWYDLMFMVKVSTSQASGGVKQ